MNGLELGNEYNSTHYGREIQTIQNLQLYKQITHINGNQSIKLSINEFLGSINREEILKSVKSFELSENLSYFIKKYEKIFGERNIFEWKWLGSVFSKSGVTLSSIDKQFKDSITDCKVLLCLLYILVDDAAEVHKDESLVNQMISVLNNKEQIDTFSNEKISLLRNIWEHINKEISKYPRYNEFKDIFSYDFKQVLNSAEYSLLINKNPEIANLTELENYDSHGMVVFLINGIDLMVSPDFNKKEYSQLRQVFWHAQQIARIGNTLGTWKREIKEKDLSSGVLNYVLSNNILSQDELAKISEKELMDIIMNSDFEDYFTQKLKNEYQKIIEIKQNIKSVDLNNYLEGIKNMMKYHIACDELI